MAAGGIKEMIWKRYLSSRRFIYHLFDGDKMICTGKKYNLLYISDDCRDTIHTKNKCKKCLRKEKAVHEQP